MFPRPLTRAEKKLLHNTGFNVSWLLVLLIGWILFYQPVFIGMTFGQVALILYLTTTIYHTIRSIPSFVEWFRFVHMIVNES